MSLAQSASDSEENLRTNLDFHGLSRTQFHIKIVIHSLHKVKNLNTLRGGLVLLSINDKHQ